VAANVGEQPKVDLIVVRENTECLASFALRPVIRTLTLPQYVKQETMTETENGKEARATRLITERASRRIGQMAFSLAAARPRKQVTIIHKSNVLSVTDGLFRETVRGVGESGKYEGITIQEQLVDSAVYRFVAAIYSRLFRD
jgi:homoisocitrate dehydrogenase